MLAEKVQQDIQYHCDGTENILEMGKRMEEGESERRVAELEQELRVAKEVSMRMHNELEAVEEKRQVFSLASHLLFPIFCHL